MSKLNLPSSQGDSAGPAITPEVFSSDDAGNTIADQIGSVTTAQSAVVKAQATVAVSRLAVQQEALRTVQSAMGVVEQYLSTQSTKAEWAGRVETARQKVEEAKVGLDKAREKTEQDRLKGTQQTERIVELSKARDAILGVLGDMRAQANHADTPPEERVRLQKLMMENIQALTKLTV